MPEAQQILGDMPMLQSIASCIPSFTPAQQLLPAVRTPEAASFLKTSFSEKAVSTSKGSEVPR